MYVNLENKAISRLIFKLMIVLCSLRFLNHPTSRYNRDNYEMIIKIIHSFINRSNNTMMDRRYNRN